MAIYITVATKLLVEISGWIKKHAATVVKWLLAILVIISELCI